MNTETKIKTPISYYGGKQSMLKHILPLLPPHSIYVEPFFGGGAVFWSKRKSDVEVINDKNGMVVNFYEQLKMNFDALKNVIDATPYSRMVYQKAMVVYENPYLFDPLIKAWAFWVGTIQGFSNKIGSWRSSSKRNKEATSCLNKKISFTGNLSERLDLTQIECMDAVSLIKRQDSENSFFYVDPPYVDSNQGHYGGYTQEHFDILLESLANITGKFMLSSYPNDTLKKYADSYGWEILEIDMALSASNQGKRKVECLTMNYKL